MGTILLLLSGSRSHFETRHASSNPRRARCDMRTFGRSHECIVGICTSIRDQNDSICPDTHGTWHTLPPCPLSIRSKYSHCCCYIHAPIPHRPTPYTHSPILPLPHTRTHPDNNLLTIPMHLWVYVKRQQILPHTPASPCIDMMGRRAEFIK